MTRKDLIALNNAFRNSILDIDDLIDDLDLKEHASMSTERLQEEIEELEGLLDEIAKLALNGAIADRNPSEG